MNNIQQYLERALEILEKGMNEDNGSIGRAWLFHLQGYLEGGIEITKLLEENDKTKNN